jgi:hypothetical protein
MEFSPAVGFVKDTVYGCTIKLYNHTASVTNYSPDCWGLPVPPEVEFGSEWFRRAYEESGGITAIAVPNSKIPMYGIVALDIIINTDPSGSGFGGYTGKFETYESAAIEQPLRPVCSLSGVTVLNHNPTWNDGLGDEISITPSVKCTSATDINITLTPNRISMGRGGEIESDLTINGKPSILLKAVGPNGASFAIKSTVHFPIETSAGSYSGSSVLKVTIQ